MAKFSAWLWRQRRSTRLAFLLQTGWRIANALTGLFWTRLLLDAMGRPLYGLFSSFQSVAALGGLGDLGLGGAVSLRLGQHLGRGDEQGASNFLARARPVFLLLALMTAATFAALSPWLPQWLGFVELPGTGSLTSLFLAGSISVGVLLLISYMGNVNYACGNLVWPVVPFFIFGQITFLAHWLLARQSAPLWLQYVPWITGSVLSLFTVWIFVRLSHPALAQLRGLRFDWRMILSLMENSFWIYICSLFHVIYTTVDRLLINKGFGPAEVPRYHLNYKLCELAVFAIVAASFVSLPKITQWLASPSPEDRARVITETQRLSQFQTVLGCAAAMFYLMVNDVFMKVWLGESMQAPLAWQLAFAFNLAITTGGDTAIQIATRIGDRGMRFAGVVIGATALLNLFLSFAAMKAQWITGIALATVLAQMVLSVILGLYVCRKLSLNWKRWLFRTAILPITAVSLAGLARWKWTPDSWQGITILTAICGSLFLVIAALLGIRPNFIRDEMRQIRSMFKQ